MSARSMTTLPGRSLSVKNFISSAFVRLANRSALSGRFHHQFRDKNRRGIGKSQSIWTDSKMETPGAQQRLEVAKVLQP
jgi:hypothetical protein